MLRATRHRLTLLLGLAGLLTCVHAPPPRPPPQEPVMTSYLRLSDGRMQRGGAGPGERCLQGTVGDGRFTPGGDVQGDGAVGEAGGMPGWMELATGTFQGDQTARPPFPPYIRGTRLPDGRFQPAYRSVRR